MLACSFDDIAKTPTDASDSWSFPILSAWPNLSSTCVLQIWWLSRMALGLGVTSYGLTSYELLFFNTDHRMYVYTI